MGKLFLEVYLCGLYLSCNFEGSPREYRTIQLTISRNNRSLGWNPPRPRDLLLFFISGLILPYPFVSPVPRLFMSINKNYPPAPVARGNNWIRIIYSAAAKAVDRSASGRSLGSQPEVLRVPEEAEEEFCHSIVLVIIELGNLKTH